MTSTLVHEQPEQRRAAIARCGCRAASVNFDDAGAWLPEPVLEAEASIAPTREQLAVLNAVKQAGGRSDDLADIAAAFACVERAWLIRDADAGFSLTILGAFVTLSRRH
jgi:hypothetical protein